MMLTPERERYLAAKWQLSKYAYAAIVKQQHGACPVCRRMLDHEKTHIDHDHETDLIRGVLCVGCNTGIGHLGDTIEGLERAKQYLIQHQTSKQRWNKPRLRRRQLGGHRPTSLERVEKTSPDEPEAVRKAREAWRDWTDARQFPGQPVSY